MKKLLPIFFILIFPSLLFANSGNGLPDTFPIIGKGCTTAYYIDEDCDGYGVGQAYVLGPDPDDSDPTVKTTADVINKYGTIPNFISTVKGYSCSRYAIVDATNGNDSTGVISATYSTALASPFANQPAATTQLPGDCVIFRTGTYASAAPPKYQTVMGGPDLPSGTATNPITYMAYPGEKFTTDPNGMSIYVPQGGKLVVDGMGGGFVHRNLTNQYSNWAYGLEAAGLTIKEMEVPDVGKSYRWQGSNASNLLFQNCVFYGDTDHEIYFTSNPFTNTYISQNLTVRGCIFQNQSITGYPVIQINEGAEGVLFENNIFWGNGRTAIGILNGGKNIVIRNNVAFNSTAFLIFYWYQTEGAGHGYLPLKLQDVIIENNSVWAPQYDRTGVVNNDPIIEFVRDIWSVTPYSVVVPNWKPNYTYYTTYADTDPPSDPYNFVGPTSGDRNVIYFTANGGVSGSSEPNWSGATTCGSTVTDGTITWIAYCNPAMSNVVIRNNIFSGYGSGYNPVVTFRNMWTGDPHDSDREKPTFQNNIMYQSPNTSDFMTTWETSTKSTYAQFIAYDPNFNHNNINADPLYTHVDVTAYNDPSTFSLVPLAGSQAWGNGSSLSDMPTYDIMGRTRSTADIGAYISGGTGGGQVYNMPPLTFGVKGFYSEHLRGAGIAVGVSPQ